MELMFYAFAPFLARLSWRSIAAIAGISLALRFAGAWLPVSFALWQGRFFPTALFLFLLGMLAHRALPFVARFPKVLGWILNAAVLAMVVALPLSDVAPAMQKWVVYGAIAVVAPFLFNAFKDNAIDRWVGDLSYPLYLCHLVVIGLVLTFEPPFAVWIAIGGAFAFSAALLLLVDHPVDRWRQRRAERVSNAQLLPA